MKRKLKFLCLLLSLVFALSIGVTACTGGPSDPGDGDTTSTSQAPVTTTGTQQTTPSSPDPDDDDEELRPGGGDGAGKTVIKFWYSGDEAEQAVFTSLVAQFNATNTDNIYVEAKVQSNVDEAIGNRFGTSEAPDVFYVSDGNYKKYVENDYLLDITDYAEASIKANPSEMWGSIYDRYYYSTTNHRAGDDADENGAWYGLPKDIGPTVIFYNETMFTQAGVTVISVAEENLGKFNRQGALDDRGIDKTTYGITGTVPAKGYFQSNGVKYFNNQIAMSWEEVRELATVIAGLSQTGNTIYGYHTEWWFSYGFSVGGDCLQYVDAQDPVTYDGGGFYDFTLVDDTENFYVNQDVTLQLEDGARPVAYKAGTIVSYQDKLLNEAAANMAGQVNKHSNAQYDPAMAAGIADGTLTKLPSQREAFLEFVLLSTDPGVSIDGKAGYGVCPSPSSMGSDGAKTQYFKNKQLGMLVDGRWNVTDFRNTVDFEWDVAPLPMYKTYNADGSVKARGIEAGHSGSVALSINIASPNPEAAWKFVEFMAGEDGQKTQSLAGFAIPSQIDLASDPNNNGFCADGVTPRGVFVNQRADDGTLLRPYNAKIFLNAAANETEGDWAYTKTGSGWIDGWASLLNEQVRNGKMSFAEFVSDPVFLATFNSLKELTLASAN